MRSPSGKESDEPFEQPTACASSGPEPEVSTSTTVCASSGPEPEVSTSTQEVVGASSEQKPVAQLVAADNPDGDFNVTEVSTSTTACASSGPEPEVSTSTQEVVGASSEQKPVAQLVAADNPDGNFNDTEVSTSTTACASSGPEPEVSTSTQKVVGASSEQELVAQLVAADNPDGNSNDTESRAEGVDTFDNKLVVKSSSSLSPVTIDVTTQIYIDIPEDDYAVPYLRLPRRNRHSYGQYSAYYTGQPLVVTSYGRQAQMRAHHLGQPLICHTIITTRRRRRRRERDHHPRANSTSWTAPFYPPWLTRFNVSMQQMQQNYNGQSIFAGYRSSEQLTSFYQGHPLVGAAVQQTQYNYYEQNVVQHATPYRLPFEHHHTANRDAQFNLTPIFIQIPPDFIPYPSQYFIFYPSPYFNPYQSQYFNPYQSQYFNPYQSQCFSPYPNPCLNHRRSPYFNPYQSQYFNPYQSPYLNPILTPSLIYNRQFENYSNSFEYEYDSNTFEYDGYPVEYDGNPVEYDGNPVEYDGNPVEYDGNPVEYDGNPVEYDGNPVQYDGNPVEYDGNPVEYDGNPVEYDINTFEHHPTELEATQPYLAPIYVRNRPTFLIPYPNTYLINYQPTLILYNNLDMNHPALAIASQPDPPVPQTSDSSEV